MRRTARHDPPIDGRETRLSSRSLTDEPHARQLAQEAPGSEVGGRELTRRELVRALTVLAAGVGLPTLAGCTAPSPAQLASLLPAGDTAAVLGAAYRAAVPAESTAEALADAILTDLGWPARRLRGRDLGQLLLARVRDDHAADRVVNVEGWTLARTEARLVALRSLVR